MPLIFITRGNFEAASKTLADSVDARARARRHGIAAPSETRSMAVMRRIPGIRRYIAAFDPEDSDRRNSATLEL